MNEWPLSWALAFAVVCAGVALFVGIRIEGWRDRRRARRYIARRYPTDLDIRARIAADDWVTHHGVRHLRRKP